MASFSVSRSSEIILSEDGTTSRDPFYMHMQMDWLPQVVAQVWYAGDAFACGSIKDQLLGWNQLCAKGVTL